MPFSFSVQQMPDWYKNQVESAMTRAQNLANEPYRHYGGQRVFPLSREQLRASELAQREGVYEPYFNTAQSLMGNIAQQTFPGMHQHYMNPYEQHVIRNMENESMRTLGEKILPAIENKFVRLGQHGGSRHRDLTLRATRDLQNDLAERRHRALAHGYEQSAQQFATDQARRLMSARELANLGQMKHAGHVADIASLEQTGANKQRQGQLAHDIDYQNFLREVAAPAERMSQWASVVHGMPYSTATHVYDNPLAAPPQMNTVGNLGNLASSMFAMRQGMR